MQKYTILFVITKLELGGAQKQLLSLIRTINHDKYTPVLLTAREGLLMPDASGIPGLSVIRSRWLERPIHPLKDLFALFEIARVCRKQRVAIIHTHSSKAGIIGRLAGRFAGVPVIIHTVHGWSFNDFQSWFRRALFLRLEKICAAFTDKLVVVSDYDRATGLRYGIGRPDQYARISYGIDSKVSLPAPSGIRESLGIRTGDSVVTMVACLKPQKAACDFVAVASIVAGKFPAARFLLVGDGVMQTVVRALVMKHKLERSFFMLGWRRDIPELLAATDVFVLTSLWEGLPVTVLEASAAAKPVVATHTGGVAEVVTDGEGGFLVKPHDVRAIAEKVCVLLDDPGLRRRCGENARRAVAGRFTEDQMCEDTFAMYAFLTKYKGIDRDA